MFTRLKIILIDENLSFREALKAILMKEYHAEIIGEIANVDQLLQMSTVSDVDVIIMNLVLPEITGIKQTIELLKQKSDYKIIALTSYNEKIYHYNLIQAGFIGCIYKDEIFSQLAPLLQTLVSNKVLAHK